MDRKLFVIRDFEITEIQKSLERLEKVPPSGWSVAVSGSSLRHGFVGPDVVFPDIDAASHCLALVDLPNANVGFEIGLALGKGKLVALGAARGDISDWLKIPPLNGHFVASATTLTEIRQLLEGKWTEQRIPDLERDPNSTKTLLLCPTAGAGDALREEAEDLDIAWESPKPSGWSLRTLPATLAQVRQVVWVIAAYPKGTDQRDGKQNTAAAVVAGFARARGLDVHVLLDGDAREVVDLSDSATTFDTLFEFRQLLEEIHADTTTPANAAPLDHYRRYLASTHSRLVPLFPDSKQTVLDRVYVELELSRSVQETKGGPDGAAAPSENLQRATPSQTSLEELLSLMPDEKERITGRWVVLGEPGAGKSTIARHLAWELARKDANPVPVYVSLPLCARDGKHPFEHAEEELRAAYGGAKAQGLAQALFDLAETTGRIWLLLDGLDEVAPEQLPSIRSRILDQCNDLPHIRVALFSRPIGYQPLKNGFEDTRLQPLSQDSQQELLRRWLGEPTAREVWAELQTREALKPLVENPLMLTLVASLSQRKSLPATRLELYQASIDDLLQHTHALNKRPVRDRFAARFVLEELALVLQEQETASWSPAQLDEALHKARKEDDQNELPARMDAWGRSHEAFLQDVAESSGVLGPHDGPSKPWTFLHRQFREFLAAHALRRRGRENYEEFAGKLTEEQLPRWSEVLAMLCGLAKDPWSILQRLRSIKAELARRALPNVDGLEQERERSMRFLVETEGWDIEDLGRLVAAWGTSTDAARRQAEEALWSVVEPTRSTEELAYVWITLEALGSLPVRERFFEQCQRPLPPEGWMEWIEIKGGPFTMGSPEDEPERFSNEGPQRTVEALPFALSSITVTNEQYEAFDPKHERRRWDGVDEGELAQHPVVNVSWWEAYLYCKWLSAELPSEAQWEFACRAGTSTPFSFGDNVTPNQVNYDGNYPYNNGPRGEYRARTVRVRSMDPNGWGLDQMHGNVYEWCLDSWHGSYDGAPDDDQPWLENRTGPGGRVLRGGGWRDHAQYCRSASRGRRHAGARNDHVGFRPARSLQKNFTT